MSSEIYLPKWYVLHTKHNFENVTTDHLLNKEFQVFNPKTKKSSRRKDRNKILEVPLFKGYIFVRALLNAPNHVEILKSTGAVRLLGYQDGPVPVKNTVIDSLKIMVGTEKEIRTGNILKKGDPIVVTYGPLKGLTGYFLRHKGNDQVAVYIHALEQFASIEIHQDDIEYIREK